MLLILNRATVFVIGGFSTQRPVDRTSLGVGRPERVYRTPGVFFEVSDKFFIPVYYHRPFVHIGEVDGYGYGRGGPGRVGGRDCDGVGLLGLRRSPA